jgi:hypothetical protein
MAPGKGELVTPGCMPTLYPSWFKWLEIYAMNLPWRGFNRALPVQHYQSMCNQTLTFELYMFQAVLKRATVTCIVTQVVAILPISLASGTSSWTKSDSETLDSETARRIEKSLVGFRN